MIEHDQRAHLLSGPKILEDHDVHLEARLTAYLFDLKAVDTSDLDKQSRTVLRSHDRVVSIRPAGASSPMSLTFTAAFIMYRKYAGANSLRLQVGKAMTVQLAG